MSNTRKKDSVDFIKPRNIIKEKVGYGSIDPKKIEAAENLMENFEFDFQTFGHELLERFDRSIKNAEETFYDDKKSKEDAKHLLLFALANVMEIKANGGMFGAPVMSQTADISLTFLEKIETISKDTFKLLELHYRVLYVIHVKRITDLTSPEASTLIKELRSASSRYFAKYES